VRPQAYLTVGISCCKARRVRGLASARIWRQASLALDGHGYRVTATQTQGGDATVDVAADHFVNQRHQDARSAGPDGMADRNRASIDIHFVGIEIEFAHHA